MARQLEPPFKSVILGKTIVAHPREWDFTGPLNYPLAGATAELDEIERLSTEVRRHFLGRELVSHGVVRRLLAEVPRGTAG